MDRAKAKGNTGISSHSGSHNVEWALYLLGDPKPISVQARGYCQTESLSQSGHMDVLDDDTCVATVNFEMCIRDSSGTSARSGAAESGSSTFSSRLGTVAAA